MYKAVIFDLDGTLLDTLGDLAESVNEMLREFSCPERSIDEVRLFVGNGMKNLVKRSVPENFDMSRLASAYEFFRQSYKKNMRNKTCPYDGIIQCLESLKEQGITVAVTSNKNDDAVKGLCEEYFGSLIDVAVGVKDGVSPKPDPAMVNNVIKELNLEKANCIFVGDSDTDIITAKNAGLKSIGVLWGFRDRETLEKAEADFVISRTEDILKIVTE